MRASVLILLLALAACGGDDGDSSCEPRGSSSGEGNVLGAPLGPFGRAALTITPAGVAGSQLALVLDEADGPCGEPGAAGRRIVIAFCVTPATGDYDVLAAGSLRCGTEASRAQVSALLEDANGVDVGSATGTLRVSYAGGCVSGDYELSFAGAVLAGDFDAVVCPAI